MKPIKLDFKNLPDLENFQSVNQMAIESLYKDMDRQLEIAVKKALTVKGYVFENQLQFYDFIKENCRAEDYTHNQEKIFFIGDTPFLKWNYSSHFDIKHEDRSVIMSANFGTYEII